MRDSKAFSAALQLLHLRGGRTAQDALVADCGQNGADFIVGQSRLAQLLPPQLDKTGQPVWGDHVIISTELRPNNNRENMFSATLGVAASTRACSVVLDVLVTMPASFSFRYAVVE